MQQLPKCIKWKKLRYRIENDTVKEYKHEHTWIDLDYLCKDTKETQSSGYLSEAEVGAFYTMC